MKLKNTIYLTILISIIFPIGIFILNFYTQNFSNENSEWADFSTYLSGFISLANFIIFIFLTKEIHNYNLKRDDQLSKLEKPILSFRRINSSNKNYYVENIGKGAAINVIISGSLNLNEKKWSESYKYYSFSSNSEREICVQNNNALIAKYKDIYGTEYISFMDNDELRYFEIEKDKAPEKYVVEYEKSNYQFVNPKWIT